jgi:hypothetical protein
MALPAESITIAGSQTGRSPIGDVEKSEVLRELETILSSPPFRSSSRSKQFLSYVVQHRLDGHDELLKERSIGTDLFHRPPDYATGDDPVVRVQAGEVRRRLEQYHHEFSKGSIVRIDLPVGSYVPEFRLTPVELPVEAVTMPESLPIRRKRKLLPWAAMAMGLALVAALIGLGSRRQVPRKSELEEFWAPVFSSPQPVLISLSKPVLYRPSIALYGRYSKDHPGTFNKEVDRLNQKLPLDPKEKITWGDMISFPDFGVGSGDVYAAFRLSGLLGKMNKPTQVRIGDEFSFDDLRNSQPMDTGNDLQPPFPVCGKRRGVLDTGSGCSGKAVVLPFGEELGSHRRFWNREPIARLEDRRRGDYRGRDYGARLRCSGTIHFQPRISGGGASNSSP